MKLRGKSGGRSKQVEPDAYQNYSLNSNDLNSDQEIERFQSSLLTWFRHSQRDLPWRRTLDPYAIWVSEIMLQQTRVAAVIGYYQRFMARFPTVHSLAEADARDLLTHWAGLGYYHRARNMQKASQVIVAAGSFPSTYQAIAALPGIGRYTAAAVASIAFNLPHAVVDGNVYRVLSRLFADPTDISSSAAHAHFAALSERLLPHDRAGEFNQALMELGATVCLPKSPVCLLCPVASFCQARSAGRQESFPVKSARARQIEETRTLYWIERDASLLLWQRDESARLMPGFWELPEASQLPAARPRHLIGEFRHGITIHNYKFVLWEASVDTDAECACRWVAIDRLDHLPVSTVLRKALRCRRQAAQPTAAKAKVPH